MQFSSIILLAVSTLLLSPVVVTAITHEQALKVLSVSKPILAELAKENAPPVFSPRGSSGLEKESRVLG